MSMEFIKVTEMTPALAEIVEMVFDGYYADEPRIDWHGFLDRVENYGFDLGGDMNAPIIKAVKKQVTALRKNS